MSASQNRCRQTPCEAPQSAQRPGRGASCCHVGAEAFVFPTLRGGPTTSTRACSERRPACKPNLAKQRSAPLSERITPHSLRTFASVLYALGEDPDIVMDGHTDPGLALRVYRLSMFRGRGRERPASGDSSKALKWQISADEPPRRPRMLPSATPPERKTPLYSGYPGLSGAIAQLGERLLCKQEVTGSIPVGSTIGIKVEPAQSRRGLGRCRFPAMSA
jgi:hypothetical protein